MESIVAVFITHRQARWHEHRAQQSPKHMPRTHLHRSRGQHEEREEQQEGAVDVADLVPLLRVAGGAQDRGSDDYARHDQRGDDDDVEVGDKVICSFNKTIVNTSRRRRLAISLTHALRVTLTLHEARDGSDAQQGEVEDREEALERGKWSRELDSNVPADRAHDLVVDPHDLGALERMCR